MTYICIYIVPSCSLTACYGKSSLFIFVYKSHINGQFNYQRVILGLSIGALLMGWPQEVEGGYLVELVFHSCTMDQIPVEESMRVCSPFSGYTVQYCALLIWEESHHFVGWAYSAMVFVFSPCYIISAQKNADIFDGVKSCQHLFRPFFGMA